MATFFLVCLLVGLGLSAVSFLAGFHGLAHLHFFHHHGVHFHHGGGAHHGGVVHHAGGNNVVHPTQESSGPSHLSAINMMAITVFLTWFGAAGSVLSHEAHLPMWLVTLASCGAGVAGSYLINRLLRFFAHDEQEAPTLTWLGTVAQVTIPIRDAGTGEIVFTHDGTRQVAGARSDSGCQIAKGTEVVITRYEKGIAYVSTWDELPAITPES